MENLAIKDNLKKAFAKHRLEVLSGFREIPEIEIPEIPIKKTLFPGTKNDYWWLHSEDDKKCSCIYELEPKGIFYTHIHLFSKEKCTILTPDSKVEWVTERDISFHTFNESFEALRGERHALVSLVDFPIQILVEWSPKMIGWNAIFDKVKKEKEFQYK